MYPKSLLIFLFVVIFFAGCSTTRYVALDRSSATKSSLTIAQFQKHVARMDIIVHTTTGDIFTSDLICSGDSAGYSDAYSGTVVRIPLKTIISVERYDYTSAIVGGTFFGGLGGLIAGAAAGAAVTPKDGRLAGVVLGGGFGMLMGGITGFVLGKRNGTHEQYIFLPSASDSSAARK